MLEQVPMKSPVGPVVTLKGANSRLWAVFLERIMELRVLCEGKKMRPDFSFEGTEFLPSFLGQYPSKGRDAWREHEHPRTP